MKKIIFKKYLKGKSQGFFWEPWGCLGCLGRILIFLFILMLVIWLLNLLHGCNHNNWVKEGQDNPNVEKIRNIGENDPIKKIPVDSTTDWRKDIPNPGENLPAPGDNYLPPVNDDDIRTGDDGRKYIGNKLNVILDSSADDETFKQWANEFKSFYPGNQYAVVFYDPNTKLLQIQVPEAEREEIMTKLPKQITDISFKIFPEDLFGPTSQKPNDPVFQYPELSWYFAPIQTFEAWTITEGDPNVKIAIVDSYFDLYHDDLNSDRIKNPYNVRRRNADVAPAEGCDEVSFVHGSMVASQALGNKNNSRGTAGIASNCSFIPVSIGHDATSMAMLNGILYAIYKGASVINVSMGAMFDDSISRLSVEDQMRLSQENGLAEQDVWDYVTELADKRNVTIVWAAGNEDVFTPLDPSKRSGDAIRVSAVDERLAKADFSNFGNFKKYNVEASTISAPGVNIFGAAPFNAYNMGPGTSFAAPIVAGAVALMKSLDPTLTNHEIIEILQETGKKPSDGCTTIGPIIQIKDALLKIQSNFVKLDDLLSDHNKLVGLWQSTELLTAIDANGPTGELVRKYFEFPNPNSGTSIVYETGSKIDFVSNVNVSWSESGLGWQTGIHNASESNRQYVALTVECKPDKNGLLQCVQTSKEFGTTKPYFLKKVKSRVIE